MKHFFFLLTLLLFQHFVFSQNTNLDFELSTSGAYTTASAVPGWSISSQTASTCGTNNWVSGSPEFSIITTPSLFYPVLGVLPNSPLGGSQIAVLNDLTPNQNVTRLSRTYSVVSNNCLLDVAFAGIWGDCGTTTCCSHSGFQFIISDGSGSVTCKSYTMSANQACRTGGITYSTAVYNSQTVTYTNWQHMYVDLTPYIGSTINIDVISAECTAGAHSGSLLFDIKQGNIVCNDCGDPGIIAPFSPTVVFCSGSTSAIIDGPLGYSTYSWTAPVAYPISASQSTLSSLSLTNAVAGSVYTLVTTNYWSQCLFYETFTLTSGSIGTPNVWTKASCPQGASGSATVTGTGSGTGYTYIWANSSNSVISTSSVVSNLVPGVYNVSVSAAGSASSTCGTAVNSVTIGAAPPPVQFQVKVYCNSSTALCGPYNGISYQWYDGYSAISPTLGGTASCLTVSSPTNGSIFRLGVNNNQGCRDSISYMLLSTTPGTLTVNSTPLACQNIANGLATLSLTPAAGAPGGSVTFTMISIGTTPSYSSTAGPGSSGSFSAGGLSASGQYSVSAFDGACFYSKTLTVNSYSFDYSLSPGTSTLCNGSLLGAGVSFSSPPSAGLYTFNWSPTTYILAGAQSQNALISPSLAPGSQTTITYSVVVNPTVINCPLTKTLNVTILSPAAPSIAAIPVLCQNASLYTISVNPPGGTFNGAAGLSSAGVITPSLSQGINTLTYSAPQVYTCAVTTSTAFYNIAPNPGLTYAINGNNYICAGQNATLSMASGLTYSWSTGSNNNSIVVSPSVNTMYTGTATYTSTGCSSTFSEVVFVTPNPSLSISGPTLICFGDAGILTANGATSYTWSNGPLTSSTSINPGTTGSYTVWGSNSYSCPVASLVQQVIVAPKPTISVSGNTSVCQGQSVSLTASGAGSFTWNSSYNGSVYTANPISSTIFTVVGLNVVTNCTSSSTVAIHIINYPSLSFTGDTSICAGESTTLNGQGALNFLWGNGSTNSWISVSPSLSSTYTLSGYDNSSCVSSLVIPVNVSDCTGLETAGAISSLLLFPNPSEGAFNLYVPETSDISIYDALGKVILVQQNLNGHHLLDLSGFTAGTYYLKITNRLECHVKKLIKEP